MTTQNRIISKIMLTAITGIIGSCMLIPLSAILLKNHGYSETQVGIYASMPWAALLIISSLIPKINKKFGIRNCYIFSAIIALIHAATLAFTTNYYLWCAANFILGICWSIRWVTGESIIVSLAPEKQKGKFVGIYGTLICAAVTVGPLILTLTGLSGMLPFYVVFGFLILSFLLILFFLKNSEMNIHSAEKEITGIWKFLKTEPVVFVVVIVCGIFENGLSPIAPLYGLSVGMSAKLAATIGAVIGFGTFATQYGIGILTDKYRHKNLSFFASFLLILSAIILFFAPQLSNLVFVSALFWGSIGGGIYTVILIKIGYKYKGHKLVAANAFMIFGYTVGGILGSVTGGLLLDILPLYGFPTLIIIAATVMSVTTIYLRKY